MNAKLPESRRIKTLIDTPVGDTVFVTPKALWADARRELWLDLTSRTSPGQQPDFLRVTRVLADGWRVDLRGVGENYQYEPGGWATNVKGQVIEVVE